MFWYSHRGSIDTWKTDLVSMWKTKNLLYVENIISLQYVEFKKPAERGKTQRSSERGKTFNNIVVH